MKYGIREICDVVLKAKATTKIGNKIFYKNEPVIYFDSLKTSSMEGAATTVYATGGKGNSRLVAWEGERTVTFTMEDALISPEGFMILSGAGLVDASDSKPVYQHIVETISIDDVKTSANEEDGTTQITFPLTHIPYLPANKGDNFAYVMFMKNGEIVGEPYIPVHGTTTKEEMTLIKTHEDYVTVKDLSDSYEATNLDDYFKGTLLSSEFDSILVDYYTEKTSGAKQIEITPDKFGGNYYLEASTLFRNTDGVDLPAEFIVPNCKIQSNFTFTMASSGDPSTFTFTMDAFPDYTRFDKTKKVLAAIQIIDTAGSMGDVHRTQTLHDPAHEKLI